MKKIIIVFLGLFASQILWSQENLTVFFEPEIEIGYAVSTSYSHGFSIENRNIIYENEEYGYVVKQIDIGHISVLKLNEQINLGLGVQYRFENTFNPTEENELRLQQEIERNTFYKRFNIKNRFRIEQRFYKTTTKYRPRYELGVSIPVTTNSNTYVKLETETLFEVAKTQKPELEQRLSSVMGGNLFSTLGTEIGLQYRLADYTQNVQHELFFILAFEVAL